MAALAVLLIAGGGAAAASLIGAQRGSVSVLVLSRPVGAGQVLTGADLRVARIAGGAGVSAMAAAAGSQVVGQTVLASLPAGTLLAPGLLSAAPVPAPGDRLLAVVFKAGTVPAQVVAGRRVELLPLTPSGSAGARQAAGAPVPATVVSSWADPGSGAVTLSVELAADAAPAVAQASADGALAVALLAVSR